PAPTTAAAPAASAPQAAAQRTEVTITDIVGRAVTVKAPVERMILTEGRLMYIVAPLEPADPFKRVVGWADDLRTTDFDGYERYKAKFSKMTQLEVFGSAAQGQFSAEKAVALKPDVLVLTLDVYPRAKEIGLVDQMEKLGVPSVVVDLRQFPLENTVPSINVMGKLLGQQERAQAVVDYYLQQVNVVYSRLEKIKKPKPVVFMYRAAGLADCCGTFGRGNLGLLIERAGGENMASSLIPAAAWSGTLNPEKVLAADPAMIIATGSNWTYTDTKVSPFVSLGYQTDPAVAAGQVKELTKTPGFENLKAVKDGKFYAIWHQFYTSPTHFAALQQFAKWLYPEDFADLDPEKSLKEFHQKFLPIEYSGAFWATLPK
ncbi:MAG: ABC transporter substrate-binding protein, partial [Chloroflexi bacterium]|nr:ABC transporter substrate-binding protein [Chloroflexota bacterium]